MIKSKKKNLLYILTILLIILLSIIIVLFILNRIKLYKNTESFENNNIPKIIHQTAPEDKSKWKSEWVECHESWKKIFPEPEYKHIMWYDKDIDDFMKNNYPDYYENVFSKYDKKIKKIDMVRYFILHKYGGIYADMDYIVYKDFYNLVPHDKISIVKSPYTWEFLQNCLMISPPNQSFWLKVINESLKRTNEKNILKSTGPILISDVYLDNKNDINVLPVDLYNPLREVYSDKLITKHLGTYSWNE